MAEDPLRRIKHGTASRHNVARNEQPDVDEHSEKTESAFQPQPRKKIRKNFRLDFGRDENNKTAPSSADDSDEVDRLTLNNAADSRHPFDNSVTSNRAPEENPVALEPRTLAEVVELGGNVTKKRFFSLSSKPPVLPLSITGSMRTMPFKGRLGSGPMRWSQADGASGKRLLLTFHVGSSNDGQDASTEGLQQLEWEAAILDWVRACCGDSDPQLNESFPEPLWLIHGTPEKENHVLCLRLTSERETPVEFDVLVNPLLRRQLLCWHPH